MNELALAQLEIAKLQLWITALAIVVGPLAGVIFAVWFQGKKDKKTAKRELYMTLMGSRKSDFTEVVMKALNCIDVVFSDSLAVRNLWHKYYALLSQQPSQEREHTWLELLTAMAKDLGYVTLQQTDLDKFYTAQGHVNKLEFQSKLQKELLRVLENTARVEVQKTPSAGDSGV